MAGPVASSARTSLGLLTSCLAALERARERESENASVRKRRKSFLESQSARVCLRRREVYAGTGSFKLWLVADGLGRQLCQ